MIVLMRHARTMQGHGRCIGRTDVPLSGEGVDQAAGIAGELGNVPFARLCSSPARRARDTLAPLAQCLGMDMEIAPDLDEIDMGEWDGLHFDDIRARFPEAYAERGRGFGRFRPPGGESFNDVADRAMAVLARLAALPRPVLAVTHAGVIRSVLCRVTGHPMDDLFHFKPGYGTGAVLAPEAGNFQLIAADVGPGELGRMLRA